MASKHHTFFLGILMAISMALAPAKSMAWSTEPASPAAPALTQFILSVQNGQEAVTGVYVPGRFSFPVVAQPESQPGFVSTEGDTVTQFGMASQQNNIGLLAHNFLAGSRFFELIAGDVVYIVYGTGHTQAFRVTQVLQYQALDPSSEFSQFQEVGDSTVISSTDMFNRVYTGKSDRSHVVL